MQVLTETDHCYCVLVNALDGEAFPSEKDTNDSSSSNKVPLRVDTNSMKTKNTHTFFLDLSAIKWSGMHMMVHYLESIFPRIAFCFYSSRILQKPSS
ncbi:hypothetical protein V6Z12_A10G032500 [Gossypium hirsutum]